MMSRSRDARWPGLARGASPKAAAMMGSTAEIPPTGGTQSGEKAGNGNDGAWRTEAPAAIPCDAHLRLVVAGDG